MNIYEIVFAQNKVISCEREFGDVAFKGEFSYEQHNGKLKYALIKAATQDLALKVSEHIIKEVSERIS